MIGKIREAVNKLIVSEFEKHGIEGLVPSHGDILAFLYAKNGLSAIYRRSGRDYVYLPDLVDGHARHS